MGTIFSTDGPRRPRNTDPYLQQAFGIINPEALKAWNQDENKTLVYGRTRRPLQ